MVIKITEGTEIYKKVADVLQRGEIVGLPTDTIYGLAVDGTNSSALKKLERLKKRQGKPFTFFLARSLWPDYAIITKRKIIDNFVPGPLTVILKKNPDAHLSVNEPHIGLRIPDLNFIINFLDYYKKPIAVTSANLSGQPVFETAQVIENEFPLVELTIDVGRLAGKPSTVLDLIPAIPIVRRKGKVSILEIERVYGRRIKIDPSLKFNLLFVCSGNSCRSPMAVGIIRTMLNDKFVEIESAGTAAMEGLPASENAQIVVKEFGGDISTHKTRYLTKELVDEADLILVMEFKHYETVLELAPEAAVKTFLLKEYKRRTKYNEVSDPVGKDLAAYRNTALEIYPSLKFVAQDITKRLLL
ncbi:MAG: L-threonylcarbamoyladenylate synthase [bacterium]